MVLERTSALVGIDIDVDHVRLVSMKPASDGSGTLVWRHRNEIDLPGLEGREPSEHWIQCVLDAISTRIPKCVDGECNIAAVSLPVAWTHYQTILGHELNETRLRYNEMFRASVFQCDAHLSHWPVVGIHHGRPSEEDQYVVAATADRIACEVSDRITTAGFEVRSILPNGVALAHAAKTLTGVTAQSVLWLSKSAALLSVIHQSGIGLSRTLDALPSQVLELDTPDRPLDSYALKPYLSQVANEIKATIKFAARADMSPPSDLPILLCGPLAELPGVDETLATLTRKPIARWRYIGRSRPTPLSQENRGDFAALSQSDPRYSTALSLALAVARTSSRGYAE